MYCGMLSFVIVVIVIIIIIITVDNLYTLIFGVFDFSKSLIRAENTLVFSEFGFTLSPFR